MAMNARSSSLSKASGVPGSLRSFLGVAVAVLALLLLAPAVCSGQLIYGRVLVQGDTTAIPGADLVLTDSAGLPVARVQTDDAGSFRLSAPGPGRFQLSASRIGLAPISAEVSVRAKEAVEVELRMAEEAIPLDPFVVVGRREIREGTLDEFYDRMARMRQRGTGQFLTKEQIENRSSMSLPLLLQTMPGVWLSFSGQSVELLSSGTSGEVFCTPEYFLDGRPMLGGYREIQVIDLEGVEVYRGYSEALHGYFPDECGTIFLWRKPDWGNPFAWNRLLLGGGLVALALALTTLVF
jgi:hypothetical protein